MKAKYICPKCRNSVNIGDQIILTGKTRTGLHGIVILQSDLGNYNTLFSEDFTVFEGNRLTLSCPICHTNLSSPREKNLAHLKMIDETNNEASIFFSQIYGEKCTFKIVGKELKQAFGDHHKLYKPDWLIENL